MVLLQTATWGGNWYYEEVFVSSVLHKTAPFLHDNVRSKHTFLSTSRAGEGGGGWSFNQKKVEHSAVGDSPEYVCGVTLHTFVMCGRDATEQQQEQEYSEITGPSEAGREMWEFLRSWAGEKRKLTDRGPSRRQVWAGKLLKSDQ